LKTIKESFDLILGKIHVMDYHLLKVLRPPADSEVIKETEIKLSLRFNNELIELYKCADGTNNDYQTPSGLLGFIPNHIFISLKDSFDYYKQYINCTDFFENSDSNARPGKKLFPFLEDGSGNCYWVDLNEDTENYGQIFWTNTFGDSPDYVYNSLTSFINVICECFLDGTFFLTPEGYLDENSIKFESISRKYNQDLKYWLKK